MNPGDPDDKVFIPIAGSVSAWIERGDGEDEDEDDEEDEREGRREGRGETQAAGG